MFPSLANVRADSLRATTDLTLVTEGVNLLLYSLIIETAIKYEK